MFDEAKNLTNQAIAIFSFLEHMEITKPSEARKGLIAMKSGTEIQFKDGNKILQITPVLLDIFTVLHYFMALCDETDNEGAFDVDEEIGLGPQAEWPDYAANRLGLMKARYGIIDGSMGTHTTTSKTLAQSITLDPFPTDTNDWINWELSTIAKFQSAGIVNILTDEHYAELNPKVDSIAAGLLKAAFASKTSFLDTAFLLEDGDLTGSGYKIWKRLCSFYEYPNLVRYTLRDYQSKLESLEHKHNGNFMDFAKKFMAYRNIIMHLQEKAANLNDVTIISPNSWKGIFINKISGDLNASATATLLKADPNKDLWECICDVNAHLTGVKEANNSNKRTAKKPANEEDKLEPKESKKGDPAPKQGPTLLQQLYTMRNQTQDEDKKKLIMSLIEDARSKEDKKRPFQGKQGKGGKNPKRRRRGSAKAHVASEDDGDDDEDRSMTGAEARSIFE